jgi:hypothetical protein
MHLGASLFGIQATQEKRVLHIPGLHAVYLFRLMQYNVFIRKDAVAITNALILASLLYDGCVNGHPDTL